MSICHGEIPPSIPSSAMWTMEAQCRALGHRVLAVGESVRQWKATIEERQRIPLASYIEGHGRYYLLSSRSSKVYNMTVETVIMRAETTMSAELYKSDVLSKACERKERWTEP